MLYSVPSLAKFNLPAQCQSLLIPARRVLNGNVVPPPADVFPLPKNLPPVRLASVTPGVRLLVSPCPLQDRTYKKKKKSRERGWLLRINSTKSDISHRSCLYVCRVV
jgi:hypothetical protein